MNSVEIISLTTNLMSLERAPSLLVLPTPKHCLKNQRVNLYFSLNTAFLANLWQSDRPTAAQCSNCFMLMTGHYRLQTFRSAECWPYC